MSDLAAVLAGIVNLMKIPFTVWGFTLTFWEIMIWSIIAFVILFVIVRIYHG